jgi:MFS superfamily sulfate permease-like transporter
VRIRVRSAAVFSNWLSLKGTIQKEIANADVVLDFSESSLVDHTVMEKLHELERDLSIGAYHFSVVGLDEHRPVSNHPKAARKKPRTRASVERVEV